TSRISLDFPARAISVKWRSRASRSCKRQPARFWRCAVSRYWLSLGLFALVVVLFSCLVLPASEPPPAAVIPEDSARIRPVINQSLPPLLVLARCLLDAPRGEILLADRGTPVLRCGKKKDTLTTNNPPELSCLPPPPLTHQEPTDEQPGGRSEDLPG